MSSSTTPDQPSPPSPLLQTTYTAHRLSPLHTSPSRPSGTPALLSSPATLSHHARTLFDILRGTTLRGVRVALDSAPSAKDLLRAGVILSCEWRLLSPRSSLGVRGVHIDVRYEHARYTALLLRRERTRPGQMQRRERQGRQGRRRRRRHGGQDEEEEEEEEEEDDDDNDVADDVALEDDEDDDGFTHLPLLLTRMPRSLLTTLTTYLASVFDAAVAPLRLDHAVLLDALESVLDVLTTTSTRNGDAGGEEQVSSLARDVVIGIKFGEPAWPAIGTMELVVSSGDLVRFIQEGGRSSTTTESPTTAAIILTRTPREQASRATTTTAAEEHYRNSKRQRQETITKEPSKRAAPFQTALTSYLAQHLALDVRHDLVRVAKVACGVFVLGADGRVKILAARKTVIAERNAASRLMVLLLDRAESVSAHAPVPG